jgi:hypothetical protein
LTHLNWMSGHGSCALDARQEDMVCSGAFLAWQSLQPSPRLLSSRRISPQAFCSEINFNSHSRELCWMPAVTYRRLEPVRGIGQ